MKKLFLMCAAALLTVSASAQKTTITSNKAGDNWYVGANVGVATPISEYTVNNETWGRLKGFAPKLGLRAGKNLTTVFGLALDADLFIESSAKSMMKQSTFIDALNVDVMGTFNLSNAFAGYQGQPRAFEVIGLIGGGYSHAFGVAQSGVNLKGAVDFAFNLGAAKALQIYVEPALVIGQPNPTWKNPLRKLNGKWNGIGKGSRP